VADIPLRSLYLTVQFMLVVVPLAKQIPVFILCPGLRSPHFFSHWSAVLQFAAYAPGLILGFCFFKNYF
jgi:hypothetical protein